MSYDFEGFFATVTGNTKEMLADAKRKWPEARVRAIDEPFCGIGIALILNQYEPPASNPAALSETFQKFVIWTGRYRDITFVWINACCIPVGCAYRGKAVRNRSHLASEDGKGALARLVTHLGVKLGSDQYFEPFTRGYFST